MCGFNNDFAIGGLGVEEQQWRPWSRDLTPCDIFLSSWTKERVLPKAIKKPNELERKQTSRYFAAVPPEPVKVFVQIAKICVKFWGLVEVWH